MNKLHMIVMTTVLISAGLAIFIYKSYFLNFPLTPDKISHVWNIETRISFNADQSFSKVNLFLPVKSDNFVIRSEHFFSGKYGLITEKKDGNKQATWSIRKAKGKQDLYYRVVVQKSAYKTPPSSATFTPGVVALPLDLEEPYLSAAKMLWAQIYENSADLDTIVGALFKRLNQPTPDETVALLLDRAPRSVSQKIETAIQILMIAGIPSRAVHGFDLTDKAHEIRMVHWLEVYYHKKWRSYSPQTGANTIPGSYLAWWRGEDPLYKVKGGTHAQIHVTAQKNEEEAIISSIEQSKLISPSVLKFSLMNLPIQNQLVYHIILLIPIGALIVVFFRNIIGVQTLGTFMPVLIALAFRETQLLWGVIFFSVIIGIGLGVRFYLERLKLLVVPRLTAVLIAVIIIIMALNIFIHNMGLPLGLSVSLFPIVIISMAVERLSIIWDERGFGDAMKQGAGTLSVAAIVYFVLSNQTLEHVMFFFPELLFILLAAAILLGRYSGFRLFELYRFREFVKRGK